MMRKQLFGWCPQPTPPNSRTLRFSKPLATLLAVTTTIVMASILLASLFMSQTAAVALTMPQATPSPSETPPATPESTPTASPTANPTQLPQPTSEPTLGPGPVTTVLAYNKTTYTLGEPVIIDVYHINANNWPVYRPSVYTVSIKNESGYSVYSYVWNAPKNANNETPHGVYFANSTNRVWGINWDQTIRPSTGLPHLLWGTGTYTTTFSFTGPMDFGSPINFTFTVVPPATTIYVDNRTLPHYSEMQAYNSTSGLTDWTAKIYPDDLQRYTNDTLYGQSDVWLYFNDVTYYNFVQYESPETNRITTVAIPTEQVLQHMEDKLSVIPNLQYSVRPNAPAIRVIVDKIYLQQLAEMPEVYCIRIVPAH